MRAAAAAIALLLVVNLATRLFVALRPLEVIDGLAIPDDAYLSLTIARSLARGLGPLYGSAYTSGFQPLYVLLMAPVYLLIHDDPVVPVHIALTMLACFDTLTLFLLCRVVQRMTTSFIPVAIVAAAWITSPYAIGTSLNGLETAISCCFLVAAIALYQRLSDAAAGGPPLPKFFALGLILGGATLARIDNLLLWVAIAITMAWRNRAWRVPAPGAALQAGVVALGVLIVNLPWLAYSHHFTGDVFPVSGRAVRFMSLAAVQHQPTFANWYLPMLSKGASVVLMRNRWPLALAAVLLVAIAAGGARAARGLPRRLRGLAPIGLYCLLLFLAYTLYVFTPWFFERYLYPISIGLLLLVGLLSDAALQGIPRVRARHWAGAALLVAIAGANLADPELRALFASRETRQLGYMNLGRWARGHFVPGTTIGSSQTGALGYFADNLNVVNLDGVVNRPCYESLVARRNLNYIRESGVQYVIGWPVNLDFIVNHSSDYRAGDLAVVGRIDEFTSWGRPWLVVRVKP